MTPSDRQSDSGRWVFPCAVILLSVLAGAEGPAVGLFLWCFRASWFAGEQLRAEERTRP
jgi:hypothetical protein